MLHRVLRFEVKREGLADAIAAVQTLVDEVGRKEGGTAVFQAFQDKDAPTRFTLWMAFRVPTALNYHQGTAWQKAFLAKMGPLFVAPPVATELTPIEPARK